MEKVSIKSLLEAGSHYGHQSQKWNPKMEPYILRKRGDIHIIDLKETLYGMDDAFSFVSDLVKGGGNILFVGTKKQAQDAIAEQAGRCGMPYVNSRWLGGMLTNFNTIKQSMRRMEMLEQQEAEGILDTLTKKEQILLKKELSKLQLNLNGVRNLKGVPDAIFVVDSVKEAIAVREANKLNIPIVGTIDTNADPDLIDYGIAINDDAIRSVNLIVEFIAEAVIAGNGAISVEEMLQKKQASEKKAKAKALVDAKAQTLDEIMDDNTEKDNIDDADKQADNNIVGESAKEDAKEEK